MSQSVVRINSNRVPKIVDAFTGALFCPSVPKIAAFQVQLVGLWIYDTRRSQTCPLAGSQLNFNFLGHVPPDFGLYGEDVAQVALVSFGPEMAVGRSIYQLRGDADPVTGPEHGSFDDGIDAKFFSDLSNGFLLASVTHDGSTRGSAQFADFRQRGNQLVGHAICKIFLLRTIR